MTHIHLFIPPAILNSNETDILLYMINIAVNEIYILSVMQ